MVNYQAFGVNYQAFDVYYMNNWVNTVYFDANMYSCEDVKKILIDRDGYSPNIEVVYLEE